MLWASHFNLWRSYASEQDLQAIHPAGSQEQSSGRTEQMWCALMNHMPIQGWKLKTELEGLISCLPDWKVLMKNLSSMKDSSQLNAASLHLCHWASQQRDFSTHWRSAEKTAILLLWSTAQGLWSYPRCKKVQVDFQWSITFFQLPSPLLISSFFLLT